ncbi:uncharacterized protein BO80DRAFT_468941 [Aspergillus ibericus CBS 121593]|uniref:Uncharacterized protein n=1 Tax=Aspergillus ibericus CBS 121593 TaxID=1448316 RepID=A0A395GKP5_9EURO|nr:hypothetical protein BO80DRAFT_468941 [Aspergillus ibericus CBS 121593]RAK96075.1 hypothetical protein BO80DRAFT_468941 [Aspergillus ibericus CBS 121593]
MLNLLNSLLGSTPIGVDQEQPSSNGTEPMSGAQHPETNVGSFDTDLRLICVKCKTNLCEDSEICVDCGDIRVKSEDCDSDDGGIVIKTEPRDSDSYEPFEEAALAMTIMDSIEIPESVDGTTAEQAAPAEENGKLENEPPAASETAPQAPPNDPKPRGRAKSPAGSSRKRLSKRTACEDCRRSKKRCIHRDGEEQKTTQPSTSMRKQAAGPKKKPGPSAKKTQTDNGNATVNDNGNDVDESIDDPSKTGIKLRIKNVQSDSAGPIPTGPAEPEPVTQKRKRGRPRKVSPGDTGVQAAPAKEIQEEEEDATLRKRVKRGTPTGDTNETSPQISSASAALVFPSPSEGALNGASKLAPHVVFSQNLHARLEDCDEKWQAAMDALREAKEMLDCWVHLWVRGRAVDA